MTKKDYIIYNEQGQSVRMTDGQAHFGTVQPFEGFSKLSENTTVIEIDVVNDQGPWKLGRVVNVLHDGPAMVNTSKFKEGWDNIFGNKKVGTA